MSKSINRRNFANISRRYARPSSSSDDKLFSKRRSRLGLWIIGGASVPVILHSSPMASFAQRNRERVLLGAGVVRTNRPTLNQKFSYELCSGDKPGASKSTSGKWLTKRRASGLMCIQRGAMTQMSFVATPSRRAFVMSSAISPARFSTSIV